jgi:hypothetical protein
MLCLTYKYRSIYDKNMADSVASYTVHGVGPYHCVLNRVDVIWAQAEERYVPTQNKSFKLALPKQN